MRPNFFLSLYFLSFIMMPYKLKILHGSIINDMETILHEWLGMFLEFWGVLVPNNTQITHIIWLLSIICELFGVCY